MNSLSHFILIIFGISLITASTAYSQKRQDPANEEDVAIAFYKTGNIKPDLVKWVENGEKYSLTPLARREEVLKNELLRLNTKYQTFNPTEDILLVQTFARIKVEESIDPATDKPVYHSTVTFSKGPDAFFFPYVHQENNFAVMPFNLEKMFTNEITPLEYEAIKDISIPSKSYLMTIAMRPREAVTEGPVEIADIHQWVLKTDILTAELWNDSGVLIWEYTSPGYLSPETKVLNELYDLGDGKASRYGIVKPFNYE